MLLKLKLMLIINCEVETRCHHVGCGKVFGKASRLSIHERTHTGERPFCCNMEDCNKSYVRRFHLIKHVAMSHGSPQETVRCNICDEEYGNVYSLRGHMSKSHNESKYTCKECNLTFSKAYKLKSHVAEHSGINSYLCNFDGCNKQLSGPRELKRHFKSHVKERYICSFSGCSKKFDVYSNLRRHIALDHKRSLITNQENISEPSLKYSCPESGCKKSFGKKSRLIVHRRTHTGERPFKCPSNLCDCSYTRQFHLNRHLAVAHSIVENVSQENLKCEECDKELGNIYALKKHQSRIHNADRFTCKECGQIFRKAQHLKTHSFTHTGVKPYKCDFEGCEQRFEVPSKLKRHSSTHLSDRFVCPYENCGFKFSVYLDLRHHLSMDHPKVCDVCGLCFDKLCRLKQHLQQHSELREVYFCPVVPCEKYYFKESSVKLHIKTKHDANFKGFECKVCVKWFVTKQKLKLHLQTHDPSFVRSKSLVKKERKARKDKGRTKISPAELLSGHREDYQIKTPIVSENSNQLNTVEDSTVIIATHLSNTSINDTHLSERGIVLQSR